MATLLSEVDPEVIEKERIERIARLIGVTSADLEHISAKVFPEEKLLLLHYVTESDSSGPPDSRRHIRGVVLNYETLKIVCVSFPHTREIVPACSEIKIQKDEVASFSPDGTILRVFFNGGKWHVATHRQLNGLNAKWNCATFGKMLDEILPDLEFENMFNPRYCYVLFIVHPAVSQVCKISNPTVYISGIFDMSLDVPEFVESYNSIKKFVKPNYVQYFSPVKHINVDEVSEAFRTFTTSNTVSEYSGILVKTASGPWNSMQCVKYVYKNYIEKKNKENLTEAIRLHVFNEYFNSIYFRGHSFSVDSLVELFGNQKIVRQECRNVKFLDELCDVCKRHTYIQQPFFFISSDENFKKILGMTNNALKRRKVNWIFQRALEIGEECKTAFLQETTEEVQEDEN